MPRLPTMRVTGSHAMSTMLRLPGSTRSRIAMSTVLSRAERRREPSAARPARLVAGGQLGAVGAPLRLPVHRPVGDAGPPAGGGAVGAAERGRETATGRLVHERHELVGKAGHGAAD